MSKKHILVLSVSAGAGHVRTAQALCAAAERGFRQLRLTHVDVMDLVPAGFRKLYADSYIKLVEKMPLAWVYLYQYTDQRSADRKSTRLNSSHRCISYAVFCLKKKKKKKKKNNNKNYKKKVY